MNARRARKKKRTPAGVLSKNTEDRNRTDTRSPSPDFESGASTSSATPAHYYLENEEHSVAEALFDHTEDRNRTDTRSPSPDFESGASTSSATPAERRVLWHNMRPMSIGKFRSYRRKTIAKCAHNALEYSPSAAFSKASKCAIPLRCTLE